MRNNRFGPHPDVKWNELTLAYSVLFFIFAFDPNQRALIFFSNREQEKERGGKMKIDEPKTPYNYDYNESNVYFITPLSPQTTRDFFKHHQ